MEKGKLTITTTPSQGEGATITHPIGSSNAPGVCADKTDLLWLILRAALSIKGSLTVAAGAQNAQGVPELIVTTADGSASITTSDAQARETMIRLASEL